MALVDTVRLLSTVELQDKLSGPARSAGASLTGLQRASAGTGRGVSLLQSGFGLAGKVAGGFGNAVSTLRSRVGGLLSGPLGILGLGAGLLSLGGLFKASFSQATEFGDEVVRLAKLTGLGVERASALAAAFHHFGIEGDAAQKIAGFAEKNLGKLTATTVIAAAKSGDLAKARRDLALAEQRLSDVQVRRGHTATQVLAAENRVSDAQQRLNDLVHQGGTVVKGAADFYAKYGLQLLDASGRAKDFNTLLLDTADFFNNKAIPAATKAAALSLIYGKSWQTLIPILSAGRQGITDAEEEARKLGLTLTKDNLNALQRLKIATREWGTALGGLKLQLGLAVVPFITDLTTGATRFLATADKFGVTGSQKIVGFFKDVLAWGQRAFGFIQTNIVPGIRGAIDNWNKLPAPLRSLLFKGFAANQTISFLLGFNPLSIGASIGGAIAGKVAVALGGPLVGSLGKFVGDFFGHVAVQKAIPQIIEAVNPIPVFVVNQGFGGPGGGLPGPGGDAEEAARGFNWKNLLYTLGLGGLIYGGTQVAQAGVNAGVNATGNRSFNDITTQAIGNRSVWDLIFGTNTAATKENTAAVQANTVSVKPVGPGLANVAHGYQQLTGKVPGSAITQSHRPVLPPMLTPEQFLARLRTTAFIGAANYKSIFERFTTFRGGGRGTDPTGQGFLALIQQLKNPKAPPVMTEIKGHLAELQHLEAYYIAHGDTTNALKVQGVINKVNELIGITRVDSTATHADNARIGQEARTNHLVSSAGFRATAAELSRVHGATSALLGPTVATSRKNFSPTINLTSAVTVNYNARLAEAAIVRQQLYSGNQNPAARAGF